MGYLIDPTFKNINRLFVFSFKNGDNNPTRNYFDKYYIPLVEIKDFYVLIENKPFFDIPMYNKQKKYEKLVEMSRNDDYTTGNLLDYLYHQNYHKNMDIDISKQTNTTTPQQINFTEILEEDDS